MPSKTILTTSYVDPDLDGVACMLAYAHFLNTTGSPAQAGMFGTPHPEARFVLEKFSISPPEALKDASGFDKVVLLDCGWMQPELSKILRPEQVVEIIDHHSDKEAHVFVNARKQIEPVGAATTLVAERFFQNNTEISREHATLLYAGIISNTLNFDGSVTTPRDIDAANKLNRIAGLPLQFAGEMFAAKSDLSGPKLIETLTGDFANYAQMRLGMGQLEIFGAGKLIRERAGEIFSGMAKLKTDLGLAHTMTNILDLEEKVTYFLVSSDETERILAKEFGIEFKDHIAVADRLTLRKQILPVLRPGLQD